MEHERKLTHDIKAFFDVMIRKFGVEGVKVQEVFSLDDEMVQMLPSVF